MKKLKVNTKALRISAKKSESNSAYEATMKNAIKKVDKAVASKDSEKAKSALAVAIKRIDKAAKKGVATKNYVARNKSRLTKKVNEME